MEDAQTHERYAQYHEFMAQQHESQALQPGAYNCGPVDVEDQVTSGGRRITTWQPCFDIQEEASLRHRFLAEREHERARRDRATAGQLLHAEVTASAPLPERERDHSVFAHRREISEIVPHYEGGQLHGVWVIFGPVPGLTAAWVRQDIACQRARWELQGRNPALEAYDPTLVPDANVQVSTHGGRVEVLVRTPVVADAEIALARARGARVAPAPLEP